MRSRRQSRLQDDLVVAEVERHDSMIPVYPDPEQKQPDSAVVDLDEKPEPMMRTRSQLLGSMRNVSDIELGAIGLSSRDGEREDGGK